MQFFLRTPHAINDLEHKLSLRHADSNIFDRRPSVPVVAIDDQPFEAATNLRQNNYTITHLNDINTLGEIRPFAIVLCDLQGVGSALHANMQGAHLIKELKKHFPEKYVIAYTGGHPNATISQEAKLFANKHLKKDAAIDRWIEVLDEAIKNVTDPVQTWKVFRTRLLDAGITPLQLTKIENDFVISYDQGSQAVERVMQDYVDGGGLTNDARAMLTNFISTAAFSLIFHA